MARLSGATAAKQRRRHADLDAGDYELVQRILDEGELFRPTARRIMGFVEADGQLWRAVVKATADGSETYVETLHKARSRDRAAARRRWAKIGRGGE